MLSSSKPYPKKRVDSSFNSHSPESDASSSSSIENDSDNENDHLSLNRIQQKMQRESIPVNVIPQNNQPSIYSQTSREMKMNEFQDAFYQDQKVQKMVQKFTPEPVKTKMEEQKLIIIRKWITFVTFIIFLFSIVNALNKIDPLPLWVQIIHNTLNTICFFSIAYSKYKNINAIYVGCITLQIRLIFGFFQRKNILTSNDPNQEVYVTVLLFMGVLMNGSLMTFLFQSLKNQINVLQVVLLVAGLNFRIYDFSDPDIQIAKIIVNSLSFFICLPLYMYCNQALVNINKKQEADVNMMVKEMKIAQELQIEQQQLFESLEEGIILIKENEISLKNSIFDQILDTQQQELTHVLDKKVFKVYRKSDQQESKSEQSFDESELNTREEIYSIKDLMNKDTQFFEDKIFEILKRDNDKKDFQYFVLKMNEIKHRDHKIIIQFIDISDKMLYNEVKAEKQFLTLINATVSHELRNPLTSLIGQKDQLQSLQQSIQRVMQDCKDQQILKQLTAIHADLKICTKKIVSASKLIDYFVQNMLDYSILKKEEKDFIKTIDQFDIRKAINEIIEIQEDKIKMKNILIDQNFQGLEEISYKIITDQKRIQQIFLNIFSNAVKFTDRGGQINILIELFKKSDQNYLRVSVTDSGIGIKKKNQDKLFKMFGSIKDEKKKINTNGIGLGLVISKLIVNKLGGEINFFSKYHRGSKFYYTIQLEQCDFNSPQIEERKSSFDIVSDLQIERHVSKNFTDMQKVFAQMKNYQKYVTNRVMVVDDEEFCIETMRSMLDNAGVDTKYQVDICINGQEALNQIITSTTLGFTYKLIFTDISMPVMNGIRATRRIRNFFKEKNLKQPPIIGVTGHILSEFLDEGKKAGMNYIEPKPMRFQVLKQYLDKFGVFDQKL